MLNKRVLKRRLIPSPPSLLSTTIPIRPALQDINDRQFWNTFRVPINRRSGICRAMELKERISLLTLSGRTRTHAFNVVGVIPCTTDSCEGSKSASDGGIAGDYAGETTAI